MSEFMNLWTELLTSFSEERLEEYGLHLLRILVIIAGFILAGRVGRRLIDGIMRPDRIPGKWDERRIHTMRGLFRSLLRYALYFFGGMVVLSELGINTASLIAGAGIVGLAIGFGAQNLVRDVISGFFILFEDQFAVGDYVTLAGVTGYVEEMGLRVTKIREWTGELHIIPNGEIKQVANLSRGEMGVVVEVEIAYEEDISRAISVIDRVCHELAGEKAGVVLEEPRVLGVEELGASGVRVRIFGKVKPMEQWAFARELRKRLKEALDEAGIEIPYPRRVIMHRESRGEDKSNASDAF